MYSEPVEEEASEFSYVSILLSRAASSSLRRSFSNSKSVFFLVSVASISEIFFCRFLFSATTFTSSLRRSAISDRPHAGFADLVIHKDGWSNNVHQ